MANLIRVNLHLVLDRDMVYVDMQMARYIKGSGKMMFRTDKDNYFCLMETYLKEFLQMVSGKMDLGN